MIIDVNITLFNAAKESTVDDDALAYFANDNDVIDSIDTVRVYDDDKIVISLWN